VQEIKYNIKSNQEINHIKELAMLKQYVNDQLNNFKLDVTSTN